MRTSCCARSRDFSSESASETKRHQHASADFTASKAVDQETFLPCILRLTLDVLLAGPGAAENADAACRSFVSSSPFRYCRPHRGFPPGSARDWIYRGKNHCHRVSLCRREVRSTSRPCGRFSPAQSRCHRHRRATATRPAKAATTEIPIVMAQDTDPVGNGFVASLARPGGNITGLSNYHPDLSGKQLGF